MEPISMVLASLTKLFVYPNLLRYNNIDHSELLHLLSHTAHATFSMPRSPALVKWWSVWLQVPSAVQLKRRCNEQPRDCVVAGPLIQREAARELPSKSTAPPSLSSEEHFAFMSFGKEGQDCL